METLLSLSIKHHNEHLNMLAETNRLLNLAEFTGNKNEVLKLKLRVQSLEGSVQYWKNKVQEDSE